MSSTLFSSTTVRIDTSPGVALDHLMSCRTPLSKFDAHDVALIELADHVSKL
jgi:hypothetical protein